MNKLNSTFKPSNTFRGNRHIVKGQIIQGDDFEIDGIRRAFWSNPDKTHSCHLFRLKGGSVVDRITVDSFENETLNDFIVRTETILLGSK